MDAHPIGRDGNDWLRGLMARDDAGSRAAGLRVLEARETLRERGVFVRGGAGDGGEGGDGGKR